MLTPIHLQLKKQMAQPSSSFSSFSFWPSFPGRQDNPLLVLEILYWFVDFVAVLELTLVSMMDNFGLDLVWQLLAIHPQSPPNHQAHPFDWPLLALILADFAATTLATKSSVFARCFYPYMCFGLGAVYWCFELSDLQDYRMDHNWLTHRPCPISFIQASSLLHLATMYLP